MANYSKEEIAAFKKKDQMNCRQSALKAASLIFEGAGCDMANPTKTVLDDAKEYYAWLYPIDGNTASPPDASSPAASLPNASLPTPTAVQKKVLDAIFEKMEITSAEYKQGVQQTVLKWAKEVHGIAKYPENLSSVGEFVKWNNKS